MKKVTQDKSQEKNYSKHLNDIEANIKKLMCRESDSKGGVIEFSEKVEAIDSPQIHQLLAVLLISLGINNTGAEEIWDFEVQATIWSIWKQKGIREANLWPEK